MGGWSTIAVGLIDHFLELIVGEVLAQLARDPLQVLERYRPRVVVIEEGENLGKRIDASPVKISC